MEHRDKAGRGMLEKVASWFSENKKLIVITFEIFWVVIFILDRIMSANTVEIPQFIYVNF